MGMVDELEAVVVRVAQAAGPAVVAVGRGAGVVVAPGQVLTNAHNLGGAEVGVRFADGRQANGRVGGADPDGDLAVVLVDTGAVAPLPWAATTPGPGAVVLALAPRRSGGVATTLGQVSAVGRSFRGPRGRRIRGSLEHTAPLAKGSSGGPVVSATGEVVGLNTNRLGEGFYLAVVADAELRGRVEALGRGETVARPHLGVALVPSRAARHLRQAVGLPPREGLLVRAVEEGGAAAGAGLRAGDLIVGAGGRDVARIDDLHEVLDGIDGRAPLVIQAVRGADDVEVTVTFAPPGATGEGPGPG